MRPFRVSLNRSTIDDLAASVMIVLSRNRHVVRRRKLVGSAVIVISLIANCVGLSCSYANAAAAAISEPGSKQVLVIYSDERLLPANVIVDDAIRKTFATDPTNRISFYSEFLDVSRFGGDAQERRQANFFRDKYAGQPPDLIISVGKPALGFLVKHRATLFTQVPVVFLAVPETQIPRNMTDARIVGIPAATDFTSTIDLALRLHPQTREIAVVAGVSPHDLEFAAAARHDLQPFEKRVNVRWLDGESLQKIQRQLSSLPDDTVVLFVGIFQDRSGKNFIPREALAQVAPASRRPIYGIFDTFLGFGIVGGSMVTFEEMGQKAAKVGLRILAGEEPQAAVREERHQPTPMFDWRQLRRVGISEGELPPGSVVLFKEYSLWEKYHWQIIAASSFCAVESLLIVSLVVQLRRRQLCRRIAAGKRRSHSTLGE